MGSNPPFYYHGWPTVEYPLLQSFSVILTKKITGAPRLFRRTLVLKRRVLVHVAMRQAFQRVLVYGVARAEEPESISYRLVKASISAI